MFWSSRKTTEYSFRYENVYVHPTAELGADVDLGPFTFVGPNCRVGDGTRLHNNVTLVGNTVIGEGNEVFPGAVLGAIPQDKKYQGEETWVILGDRNTIRECVTINCGTAPGGGVTRLGNRNLIMASCHIAHDCILEDDITMANNVLLGGHVRVDHHASFGGLAAIHHFVTVGQHAFVGGLARVTQDVPPFMLVEGNPVRIWSINKVGLKRQGFAPPVIKALKEAHRLLVRSRMPRREAIETIQTEFAGIPEVAALATFLLETEKGNQGRARQP
ncbi:MAG TPA: acyl-ACP--UDP-N-acetylglucosamine O-acyltransferase [Planctomycetota bacterium]|nr:acyl-ACP--UDP-N-acetylglucosamine O-acyltransferase [Planctomycetota bacterium]